MNILEEAGQIVEEREKNHYGKPENSFKCIAAKWSASLTQLLNTDIEIKPEWVPILMIDLKMCRQCHKPKHDNWLDTIGYSVLGNDLDAHQSTNENTHTTTTKKRNSR